MNNTFQWIPFYEELARTLLLFKDKRGDLFDIMKRLVSENQKLEYLHFERDDWWGARNYEIDPFSVFASFNRGLTDENRTLIAKSLATEFNLASPIPTEFIGIPVMNLQNSFFGGNDEIWTLFDEALSCAKTAVYTNEFLSAFDRAISAKGNGLASITMGLFWISPHTYLNLDSQNRAFLSAPANKMDSVIAISPKSSKGIAPSAVAYIAMCSECKHLINTGVFPFQNFPELSYYSWLNQPEQDSEVPSDKLSKANFLQWFAPLIQALKDLGGSAKPDQARLKIVENEHVDAETLNAVRGKHGTKKFDNEVAWARNYLVYAGIIDKSNRGVWSLTEQGRLVEMTDELASQIFRRRWQVSNVDETVSLTKKHYWLYSPGEQARLWSEFNAKGIMGIGWESLENLADYSSREELKGALRNLYGEDKSYIHDSLATWQFANEMNTGDIVYVKKGLFTLVGRGIITSEYIYDETRGEYRHIRRVDWTHNGQWEHPGQAAAKTLTDITQYTEYVDKLEILFSNGDELPSELEHTATYSPYNKDDFLSQVFMDETRYETLTSLLARKKNIILQGAPGVGKTYAAKRLAYSIMGEKDSSRVEMIQFHQSYSYEDFIMGYRPDGNGFSLARGVFYKFCKRAQDDDGRDYFFIIDEINRGNLSKIFGELFMLIEHDKRDEKNSMRLLYADEQFYIPSNIHLIGMMNTADRSLAMLDYALRRRFAFFEMPPAFDSQGFKRYQDDIANDKFNRLVSVITALNSDIEKDLSLGAGFRIGHSYLIKTENTISDDFWLNTVVNYELIPLLQEYWFDEPSKVSHWSTRLLEAIL